MNTKRVVTQEELDASGAVEASVFFAELGRGPMTFGRMFAAYRKCEEVTLQDFADRLGVSRQRVCDYEKGRKLPSPEMAWKMGEALGYSGPHFARRAIEESFARNGILASVTIAERPEVAVPPPKSRTAPRRKTG